MKALKLVVVVLVGFIGQLVNLLALFIFIAGLLWFAVSITSCAAGAEPHVAAPPPPGLDRDDVADHGAAGSPTTSDGCRRDFCPSAWPNRVALRTHSLGFLFCECTCEPPSVTHPLGRLMWWTALPWPEELLPKQRASWSAYCPEPQP